MDGAGQELDVTEVWFTNERTGETVELSAEHAQDGGERMTLTWGADGVARLELR
jgi:hypothetical protein